MKLPDRFLKSLLALTLAAAIALQPAAAAADLGPEATPACGCGAGVQAAPAAHAPACPLYEQPEEPPAAQAPQPSAAAQEAPQPAPAQETPEPTGAQQPAGGQESAADEPEPSTAPETPVPSPAAQETPEPAPAQQPDTGQALTAEQAALAAAEAIAALPDPAALNGDWQAAPADDITAARGLVDALTAEALTLLPGEAAEKLTALEHIRDTRADCADLGCPWHYPPEVQAEMNDPGTPRLLTLADLQRDYGVTPKAQPSLSSLLSAPHAHPQTIAVLEDNEDNAHSGKPDRDFNTFVNFTSSLCPVEARFDIEPGTLPTQSAYLAIQAYDVDEEYGEDDHVFVNGVEVGLLSGTSCTWNTTVLEIPLDLLREGANYVEMYPSEDMSWIIPTWVVKVGWMQLILDGGASDANLSSFSLSLGVPEQSDGAATVPATVQIVQAGSTEYITEYSLLDENGNTLSAASGKAERTETVRLALPAGSADGVYTVLGILKDPETQAIKATDRVTFQVEDGAPIVGPKISHTLTPAGLTNGDVTVDFALDTEGYESVSISFEGAALAGGSDTVSENGVYRYTVDFTTGEGKFATTYTVTVDNIDKTPPEIACDAVALREDSTLDQAKEAVAKAVSVTDDRQVSARPVEVSFPGWESGLAGAAAPGTATVTAQDAAGNQAAASCEIEILYSPASLAAPTAAQSGEGFALASTLEGTGGHAFTETGFVWGTMPSPTLSLNQGFAKMAAPAAAIGDALSASAENLARGVTYYARAYASYQDEGKTLTVYSPAVTFGLGIPDYGTFSVRNNGNNTFTVSRAGGSEGAQTVWYRTVNGSAIGGTHFTHQAGPLAFADGETSKTITVPEAEQGAMAQYKTYPATAYSNADRTYQLELVRISGGASIASGAGAATRTMPVGSSYHVDRSLFEGYKSTAPSGETQRGDYDDDGLGWTDQQQGSAAASTVDFSGLLPQRDYWEQVADELWYRFSMQAKEENDGYQHIQINLGSSLDLDFYPYQGKFRQTKEQTTGMDIINYLNGYSAKYAAVFQHGGSGKDGNYKTYYFPNNASFGSNPGDCKMEELQKAYVYNTGADHIVLAAREDGVLAVGDMKVTVGFSGSGDGHDKWYSDQETHYFKLSDTSEPRLLGMAPMAGGTYLPGETVTVALVFDEIVDARNSDLTALTITTNYGTLAYAGGADTNVLYFTGALSEGGSGAITLKGIQNAMGVKDMCENAGTNVSDLTVGSGSTPITVDTSTVSVSISGASAGALPRHSATVTAAGAQTLQYAWSQSEVLPAAGWLDVPAGGRVTASQTSGDWYLHALAVNENGKTDYACRAFTFRQPTLTLSVDPADGWSREKAIRVTAGSYTGSVSIALTGAGAGTTLNGSGEWVVDRNGAYTATLTDGYGSAVTASVEVTGIDRAAPTAAIREWANTAALHEAVELTATAGDEGGSGIAKVEYQWTDGTAAPADGGWLQAGAPDGGVYTFAKQAIAGAQSAAWQLYIRVTDGAGNATTAASKVYTLYKAPASYIDPAISLKLIKPDSAGGWVKKATLYTYVTRDTGSGPVLVTTPAYRGGAATDKDDLPAGMYYYENSQGGATIQTPLIQNGFYTSTLTDETTGRVFSASLAVNDIDNDAPILDRLEVSNADAWAAFKTVTLAGLTDDVTPTYGLTGEFAAYDGSGVARAQWKPAGGGDEEFALIAGDSFTVIQNGAYTVRLTDNLGNWREYAVTVAKIDAGAPTVLVTGAPEGWSGQAVTLTVAAQDAAGAAGTVSGVAKVEYALTGSDAVPTGDSGWTAVADDGSVTVAASGDWYLHARAIDNAGNVSSVSTVRVRVDTAAPTVAVSDPPQGWSGKAVTLTVTAQDALSGIDKVEYALAGSETAPADGWAAVTGGTVTVSRDGSWYLHVRATDRMGNVASAAGAIRVDAGAPTVTVTGAPDGWTNQPATLTVDVRDALSGVDKVEYALTGSDAAPQTGWAEVANGGAVTVSGDSARFLHVRAADGAGNLSAALTTAVKVDTTIPTVTVSDPPQGWSSETVTLTVTGADAMSGVAKVEYALTGSAAAPTGDGGWTAVSGDTAVIAAGQDGTWYLHARARDNAGNVSAAVSTGAIRVDTSAPVLTVTGGETPAQAQTLTVAARGTAPVAVTVQKDGGEAEAVPLTEGQASYAVSEPGRYLFTAVSEAGLSATRTVVFHRVAFTDPQQAGDIPDQLVMDGKAAAQPADPAKSGFTFAGWQSGGAVYAFETAVTGDLALTALWTLNEPAVRLTADSADPVYNTGTAVTLTASPSHDAAGTGYTYAWAKDGTALEATGSALALAEVADSGVYTVTVTAAAGGLTAQKTAELAVTIAPAQVSFDVAGSSHTYDAAEKSAAVTQSADDPVPLPKGAFTVAYQKAGGQALAAARDAGEYDILVTLSDPNFAFPGGASSAVVGSLAIAPAQVSFDVAGSEQEYDSTAKSAAVTQSADDPVPLPKGAFTVAYQKEGGQALAAAEDAGEYDILVTLDDPNFAFPGGESSAVVGRLTVTRRPVTAAWLNLRRTYGDGKTVGVVFSETVEGDELLADIGGLAEDAGEHPLTLALAGSDAGNYRLEAGQTATLTIQKAPVSFAVSGNVLEADGKEKSATVTPSEPGAGFTVSYRQDGQAVEAPAEPGEYEIWVELTGGNYRHSGGTGSGAQPVGTLYIYADDPPALYAVAFHGGEGAQGEPPALPDALAGQLVTLPENTFAMDGFAFAGWGYGDALYQPGDSFTMPAAGVEFTARWVESAFQIGGTVVRGGEGAQAAPESGVTVTLTQGADTVAETVTGADGSYLFEGVAPGLYNLVASKGGITVTVKVEITAESVAQPPIALPAGRANSVVEVAAGSPAVVVGKLDTVFHQTDGTVYTAADEQTVTDGGLVEITFSAEKLAGAKTKDEAEALATLTRSREVLSLYMDFTLTKEVYDAGGRQLSSDRLTESSVLLEVDLPLPRELQGKYSYGVYRVHEGEPQALPQGSGEEYFTVNGERTMLTLHVKRFSTYAVACAAPPAPVPPADAETAEQPPATLPEKTGARRPTTPDACEQPAANTAGQRPAEAPGGDPDPGDGPAAEPEPGPAPAEKRGCLCLIDLLTGGRTHFCCPWCWLVLAAILAAALYALFRRKKKAPDQGQ